MANLKLKLACWGYDRTRPLIDGRVRLEGIDLEIDILCLRQSPDRSTLASLSAALRPGHDHRLNGLLRKREPLSP